MVITRIVSIYKAVHAPSYPKTKSSSNDPCAPSYRVRFGCRKRTLSTHSRYAFDNELRITP